MEIPDQCRSCDTVKDLIHKREEYLRHQDEYLHQFISGELEQDIENAYRPMGTEITSGGQTDISLIRENALRASGMTFESLGRIAVQHGETLIRLVQDCNGPIILAGRSDGRLSTEIHCLSPAQDRP